MMSEESQKENVPSKCKPKIDISSLKLPLKEITDKQPKYANVPLSAPSRMQHSKRQNNHSARHNSLSVRSKRRRTAIITPRMDELPLSLRLHSNPMILLQSLRRQKISNYNMYHIEPAIDNRPSRMTTLFQNRRKRLRDCKDPFPNMPPLDASIADMNEIPIFVAKQLKYEVFSNKVRKHKEHKQRLNTMMPHIDNKLPKNINLYRKMRRERLKNAKRKARKWQEHRLMSPPFKCPKPPTRRAPAHINQIRNKRLNKKQKAKKKKAAIKKQTKKLEVTTVHDIVYVDERTARSSVFVGSPKRISSPIIRSKLVKSLPCHFEAWDKGMNPMEVI